MIYDFKAIPRLKFWENDDLGQNSAGITGIIVGIFLALVEKKKLNDRL